MDHRYAFQPNRVCFLPQRYITAILVTVAITITYTMRVFVPVAVKHMIKPSNKTSVNITYNETLCEDTGHIKAAGYKIQISDKVFTWSSADSEIMSSGFFGGYLVGHMPGGILADLYGGKSVMSASIFGTSIITMITPIVMKTTEGGVIEITVVRFLVGVFVGMLFPCAHSIISQWGPVRDRGKLTGIIFVASQCSIVLNNVLTRRFIYTIGSWSAPYYLYGGMGILFLLFWQLFGTSYPGDSRLIDRDEFIYLQIELAGHVRYGYKKIPWRRMARSAPLWALVLAQIGHTWIWHVLIKDLPKFLRDVLRVDILQSDVIASVPYAVMSSTTILGGFASDHLINRGTVSITTMRKTLTTFGAMGPAIFIVAAGYIGYTSCNVKSAISMFTVGLCIMSSYYVGTRVNCFDLAPNYSGIIMGLANGLGALPGLIAPRVQQAVLDTHNLYSWVYIFWIHLIILAFTNIVYIFCGTGKEQLWNDIVKHPDNVSDYSQYSQGSQYSASLYSQDLASLDSRQTDDGIKKK